MIFTCIECNNDTHELSGDLEERTCFNCLDAEETITEKNIIDYKVKFNYDNDERSILYESLCRFYFYTNNLPSNANSYHINLWAANQEGTSYRTCGVPDLGSDSNGYALEVNPYNIEYTGDITTGE